MSGTRIPGKRKGKLHLHAPLQSYFILTVHERNITQQLNIGGIHEELVYNTLP